MILWTQWNTLYPSAPPCSSQDSWPLGATASSSPRVQIQTFRYRRCLAKQHYISMWCLVVDYKLYNKLLKFTQYCMWRRFSIWLLDGGGYFSPGLSSRLLLLFALVESSIKSESIVRALVLDNLENSFSSCFFIIFRPFYPSISMSLLSSSSNSLCNVSKTLCKWSLPARRCYWVGGRRCVTVWRYLWRTWSSAWACQQILNMRWVLALTNLVEHVEILCADCLGGFALVLSGFT